MKPELRFISKDGPRCSFAMARPCSSNAFKVSMYSFIKMGMEHIVEEEEPDIQVEGRMVSEGALDIYFCGYKESFSS